MTYFGFLALFLLPPLVLIAWRLGWDRARRALPTLLLIALIAVAYTTPWDHWILTQGVWSYPAGRVVGLTVGRVPVEEIAFMVLQVAVVGGALALALPPAPEPGGE